MSEATIAKGIFVSAKVLIGISFSIAFAIRCAENIPLKVLVSIPEKQ